MDYRPVMSTIMDAYTIVSIVFAGLYTIWLIATCVYLYLCPRVNDITYQMTQIHGLVHLFAGLEVFFGINIITSVVNGWYTPAIVMGLLFLQAALWYPYNALFTFSGKHWLRILGTVFHIMCLYLFIYSIQILFVQLVLYIIISLVTIVILGMEIALYKSWCIRNKYAIRHMCYSLGFSIGSWTLQVGLVEPLYLQCSDSTKIAIRVFEAIALVVYSIIIVYNSTLNFDYSDKESRLGRVAGIAGFAQTLVFYLLVLPAVVFDIWDSIFYILAYSVVIPALITFVFSLLMILLDKYVKDSTLKKYILDYCNIQNGILYYILQAGKLLLLSPKIKILEPPNDTYPMTQV